MSMNQKLNLNKLKKAGYHFSNVGSLVGNSIFPYCILCEAEPEIMVPFYWVDEQKKLVIRYDLCEDCNEELLRLSKHDQISLIVNVIEKKIMALPRIEGRFKFYGDDNVKNN